MRRIPELLAPAGTKEAFIAAVEAGADAIYCGGTLFNARMNAGNFDDEALAEAIGFAHVRGVKVYVTMNTLLTDEELPAALSYCARLAEWGADALIIQDLGLGKLVRDHLPDLPIHLSTQASVFGPGGIRAAAKLGYERVVTARELSLEEIRAVCALGEAEIEVFCHGALCICYSGQCQMSRAIGGRSGNRGACAQPCRLPYEALAANGKPTGEGPYALSPADMCMIDHLGELAEAGVASLKIEGRMKSPEYVGVVVSIYRKYLDLYAREGSYTVSREDREALAQIFSRGFTDGYFSGEAGRRFMSGRIQKNKGILVGTVTNPSAGRNLVEIRLEEGASLEMGDGVEIRGRDTRAGNLVTYLKASGKGRLVIGDLKDPVAKGDSVYRLTSKAQMAAASLYYKGKDWHEGKYLRRLPVTMTCVAAGDTLSVTASGGGKTAVCRAAGITPGEADASARIEKALRKSGGTPFEVAEVRMRGNFDLAVSMSQLNEIRREALSLLEETLLGRRAPREVKAGGAPLTAEEARVELMLSGPEDPRLAQLPAYGAACRAEGVPLWILVPAALLAEIPEEETARWEEYGRVLPYISNISKGREDAAVAAGFDEICRRAGERGILLGNPEWACRFAEAGVPVLGDYGWNVYNGETLAAMAELGVQPGARSLEAEDPAEGPFPLMVSEHRWRAARLIDRKGAAYRLVKQAWSDQTQILREAPAGSGSPEEAAAAAAAKGRPVRLFP